ncbi:hypothetical protein MMC14_002501 [Varicellaria rhodocarpa]|nr:hypothetical protein [Varicellaria rhodocarpa]
MANSKTNASVLLTGVAFGRSSDGLRFPNFTLQLSPDPQAYGIIIYLPIPTIVATVKFQTLDTLSQHGFNAFLPYFIPSRFHDHFSDSVDHCNAFFELDSSMEDYPPVPHPKPLYHSGWCRMHMVHTKRSATLNRNEDYQQFTVDIFDSYDEALVGNKTVHWWGTKLADTTCRFPNPVPRGEVAGDPKKTFEWVYNKNEDELNFCYGDQHWKVEDEGNGKRIQEGKPPRKQLIPWRSGKGLARVHGYIGP